MNPQTEFLKYLRFKRHYLACDEVTTYGCRADVLAVDKNKKHVIEYEFKNSSQDLHVAEKKKTKYGQHSGYKRVCNKHAYTKGMTTRQPHRFYFVIPKALWEKEKVYLEKQNCGVIMYYVICDGNKRPDRLEFLTMKPCKLRKKNLQKYEVVARDLLIRCTSAYVSRLDREEKQKEFDELQETHE